MVSVPSLGSILAAFVVAAASATDGDVVARAANDGPLADLGALRVAIYVVDASGSVLYLAGHSGGEEVRHLYSTLPIDESTPNAIAFSSGAEVFLGLEEVIERYPVLGAAAALYADAGPLEFAALPLRHAGDRVGVLGVLFSAPIPRTWESRAALDATTAVVSLWCSAHLAGIRSRNGHGTLTLTQRQRAVLRLAASGETNPRIAAQLGFAESTVKADLTALYRLTGARSRQELLDRTRDIT